MVVSRLHPPSPCSKRQRGDAAAALECRGPLGVVVAPLLQTSLLLHNINNFLLDVAYFIPPGMSVI